MGLRYDEGSLCQSSAATCRISAVMSSEGKMTIIERLQKEAHPKSGIPPREMLISDDELEPLAAALNALRMHPFKDIPKITPEDIRVHGCRMYGIPVRVASPRS